MCLMCVSVCVCVTLLMPFFNVSAYTSRASVFPIQMIVYRIAQTFFTNVKMYSFTYTTLTVTRYYLYKSWAHTKNECSVKRRDEQDIFQKAICVPSAEFVCVQTLPTNRLLCTLVGLFMLQTSQVLLDVFNIHFWF